tara:strand:- start:598 stop:825 length:228 start_codon:yes stop_codon:yes gene_type:complete
MNMKTFQTSDIGIAAFVMMKGLKLKQASKSNNGRFSFIFDDPNALGQQYAVDYVNSEAARFDANMKNLKNILYKS